MEELIAKRYVKALLEVIAPEKKIVYSQVLNSIASLFDNESISKKISSPLISSDKKVSFILSGVQDSDSSLINFIKILGENGRLNLIPAIAKSLKRELQREINEYSGIVTSTNRLNSSEIKKLEKSLERYTGSTIKLSQAQSDLDGIKVTVDDLGIEVNFSKQRVKEQLIDFITKSL